jgi:hypothetical protein
MLMDNNFIDRASRGEVKRLLNIVRGAVGKEDITKSANAVVDLMTNHLLRQWRDVLQKQLSVRASKVDSKGVEVQGRLDVEGQRMMKAAKEAMGLSQEQLAARMAEVNDRMGDDNEVIAKNAATEYEGLLIAKQYLEEIKASQEEEQELKRQLNQDIEDQRARKRGEGDEDPMENAAFRQYRESVEDAIRENKVARVEAYQRLVQRLGRSVETSMNRASEFAEKERERVREIQHNANSDLEGVAADEQSVPGIVDRLANTPLLRFFMKPLATFDTMLRFFGKKSVDGKGYLFNRFMPQWEEANDRKWKNLRAAHKELDAKAKELFGVKHFVDLQTMKAGGASITVNEPDGQKEYKLSAGNLLYIYMVSKMSDGRMKLYRMGISKEDIAAIESELDPRLITLADWIQNDFLVRKREDYNKVHERMFGAPMAAIDNYFPLKINSRSRHQEMDVSTYTGNEATPSTTTGSIIKRVKNATPLDLHADAFDVVLEHLEKMEQWAAFAEFNRDLNSLLSYKRFRNRVENMASTRYGSGKVLWQNFSDVCAIAAGTYHPKVNVDSIDKTVVNVAKGITAAKISLRLYTALKQLTSYPAYLSEASVKELAKTTLSPKGWYDSWNWCIDNMPGFAERWQSRQAGDNRLKETDADWQVWRNKIVETAARVGMSPNALIDAWTVAMGAKAIYETARKRYQKMGFNAERAHNKALMDASIAYNETQQSSQAAFLSAMQSDRTVASVALTVFRNASMGYERRFTQALSNLGRKMTPGYRKKSIEFMQKQLIREGLDEEDALKYAKRMYNRSWASDLMNTAIFGFVLQFVWNMAPYMPYILMGDDGDDKKDMLEDATMHALAGPIEGLSLGAQNSEIYNLARQYQVTGDTKTERQLKGYDLTPLPLISDLQKTIGDVTTSDDRAWYDVANLLIQSGLGVNPQTLTDGFVAIYDYCKGDPETGMDFALTLCRIAQMPTRQLDMVYIDQLGMFAHDARNLQIEDLAKRWAHYKRLKEQPLSSVFGSEESNEATEGDYIKKFKEKVEERLAAMGEDELREAYDYADIKDRAAIGKEASKQKGEFAYGDTNSTKTEYGRIYAELRTFDDLLEDARFLQAQTNAKGSESEYKKISAARKRIRDMAKSLGHGQDDVVMEDIRRARRKAMDDLGI